jgi:hypothetical protein
MDLDTRPPEMERSTMSYWIQECPHCGYISYSLENVLECEAQFLESSDYRDIPHPKPVSSLAWQFIKKGKISERCALYEEALFDYLHAAWASDDIGDTYWQTELRLLALKMIESIVQEERTENMMVLRADLLRKTRQFDTLIKEYSGKSFSEDIIDKIIAFQIAKAHEKSIQTFTVEDAL